MTPALPPMQAAAASRCLLVVGNAAMPVLYVQQRPHARKGCRGAGARACARRRQQWGAKVAPLATV
eukprot:352796-Chlamydomonas_euryale.AAC.2